MVAELFEQRLGGEVSQNCLDLLVAMIYKKENLLVENLTINKDGRITAFSYKLLWVVFNPEYDKVCEMLGVIKNMAEIKNPKKFVFKNQSLQMVLKMLINEFRGTLPNSNLSYAVSELFTHEKRGAYTDTVRPLKDNEIRTAFTLDIAKCHTSILYNAEHMWGILMPWDTLIKKSVFNISEGSYYQVSKDELTLGSHVVGSGLYSSEFVSKLLENYLIKLSDITHELRPSHTIPANFFREIVDLVYAKCKNIKLVKELFNKFIGSLGKMTKITAVGELSTSAEFANHWKYSNGSGEKAFEKPTEGFNLTLEPDHLRNLVRTTEKLTIDTNYPIYQAVIHASWWELYLMEKDAIQMSEVPIETVRLHSDSITFAVKKTPKFQEIEPTVCSAKITRMEDNGIFSESDDDDEDEVLEPIELNRTLHERFIPIEIPETVKANAGWQERLINNMNQLRKPNPWGIGYIRAELLDNPNLERSPPKKERMPRIEPDGKIREITEADITDAINGGESFAMFGEAGRGKTYMTANVIVPQLRANGKSFITASLSHKATENLRKYNIEAVVIAKIFAIAHNETLNARLLAISQTYDYIIIDEYTLCGLAEMLNFYTLKKMGMNFIFVGDYHQLPAVESYQVLNYRSCPFFWDMCDKTYIELKTIHRFDMALNETLTHLYKYGELIGITQEITSDDTQHICYTNKTKDSINLGFSLKNDKYEKSLKIRDNFIMRIGSPIICKVNHLKGFHNSSVFTVQEFTETVVEVIDQNGDKIDIDLKDIKEKLNGVYNFELGNCITIHSAQGSTLLGRVAIHEISMMTREMLYTAISRATSLNNVCIRRKDRLIKGLQHTKFMELGEWESKPLNILTKSLVGQVYEIYDTITEKPIYIESVSNNKTLKPNLTKLKKGILSECKNKLEIRLVEKLYYDFEDELETLKTETIVQYQLKGIELMNPKLSMPRRLKAGEFKPNKARQLMEAKVNDDEFNEAGTKKYRGFISILKDCVRFRYSVNGVAKIKQYKITKKRTLEQAKAEAEEFQKNHYA